MLGPNGDDFAVHGDGVSNVAAEEAVKDQPNEDTEADDGSEWEKAEIALEYQIHQRYGCELDAEIAAEGGTVGMFMLVKVCLEKNKKVQMNFAEALNKCYLDCSAELEQCTLPEAVLAELAGKLAAICHFLSAFAQLRFKPQAVVHFQRLVDELSRPLTGVLGMLARWRAMDERQQQKFLVQFQGRLSRAPQTIASCVMRLGEFLVAPEAASVALAAGWPERLKRFAEAQGEACRLLEEGLLPQGPAEEAVQVALRVHRSTEEQTFSLHREATVGDLLRQMPDAHAARILIRVKPTGKVRAHWDSKWTELPPDVPLGMLANTAPALKGPAADVALQVELSPDAALGLGVEPWLPPWPFPMWPGKYPVLKVTVLTATRMLAELRAAYDEPDFQREYRQLRRAGGMSRHVGKALSVQCDIVQRYGFAGDLGGVEEMRKQATYWANTDPAVVKLLRDIHGHLEYGKPWRKVLVPEAVTARTARCRAGRAALGAWWPTAPSEEQAAQLRGDVQAACEEAARRIAEADVLLLCTGAGFSADSGLAVYADVAEVEAYRVRGLEYHDLCTPKWLRDEPELFWGFWGQCFNDYRGTAPHEGYGIVARWADRRFRRSGIAEAVNFRLAEFAALSRASAGSGAGQPYVVKDHAGAFFAFTSNVDAHHFDWFRACEIRECHGSTELYQCAYPRRSQGGACIGAVWRAPQSLGFLVDDRSMLAPAGQRPPAEELVTAAAATEPAWPELQAAPRVGHVRGGGRPTPLRHMPPAPAVTSEVAAFGENHPLCPFCRGRARPAVQMFADVDWCDVQAQADRWDEWVAAVRDVVMEGVAKRIVVLEIGAGGRVTTVRKTSEQHLRTFRNAGAEVQLIRVNPDLPLGDSERYAPGGSEASAVVSIMARGLESLRMMDEAMPESMR